MTEKEGASTRVRARKAPGVEFMLSVVGRASTRVRARKAHPIGPRPSKATLRRALNAPLRLKTGTLEVLARVKKDWIERGDDNLIWGFQGSVPFNLQPIEVQ